MIDHEKFTNWLNLYGKAWETLDPDAIIEIFAEDSLYYKTPFAAPFKGREGIHHYWTTNALATQKDVNFGYDSATVSKETGLAHWWAIFTIVATGEKVEIDGYLMANFDSNAQCTCFREWWHVKEQ